MSVGVRRRGPALLLSLLLLLPLAASAAELTASQRAEDFDALWRAIDSGYAYHAPGHAPWRRARQALRARALEAHDRDAFLAEVEKALALLRDDHVTLRERSAHSPRRVPAETDLWPTWRGGTAYLEAVRPSSEADSVGLKPGDVVTGVNGVAVDRVVREWLARGEANPAARDWALRHALAGPHAGEFRVEVRGGKPGGLTLGRTPPSANGAPFLGRRVGEARDLGYLRIKPALRVEHFDAAMNLLQDTRALILDLREYSDTEAIRATTLAIFGRFIAEPRPYQIREVAGGKRDADVAAPRGTTYRAPVVVLVDRWTAGEGEVLAAALHAQGARLIGTPMAGLRGELHEVKLPHSGATIRFPAQKAFAPDATPREALRPDLAVDLAAPQGGPGDPILYQALKLLEK